MSLRDQILSASAGLVRRQRVFLPECGKEVQVRGLMAGEVRRAGEHKRSADVQVALSVEDPETGTRLWDADNLIDLDQIAGLHSVDVMTILHVSNELSGMKGMMALGKAMQNGGESGSTTSLSLSENSSGK